MNAYRTISRVLVVIAVVAVSAASASQSPSSSGKSKKSAMDENTKRLIAGIGKVAMPVLTKEVLKDQNPYLSPIAEGAVATIVNGHLPINDRTTETFNEYYADTFKYFGANVASRELAVFLAANTMLNKKNLEGVCDDYVGAVPYVGKPVSKTIKKITPSLIETAHNSFAASVKTGKPTLEFTISLN